MLEQHKSEQMITETTTHKLNESDNTNQTSLARSKTNYARLGVDVLQFDEKEDATCIDKLQLLEADLIKRFIVVPILSVLSLFVFALFLFWKPALRLKWLYKPVNNVRHANYAFI